MASISLLTIVNNDEFIDAYNQFAGKEHPVDLAFKILDISEIIEDEREKYRKVYQQKLNESMVDGEVDRERAKQKSQELTEYCKRTMVEFPDIDRAEIGRVTINPEVLRILCSVGLIRRKEKSDGLERDS